MPDGAKDSKDQLELLRSLPIDESTESKVEALWRQLMIYKSFSGGDLSEAKARRAEAEVSREQAEVETIKMTKSLCERMRRDAERDLDEVRQAKVEALKARQDAQAELTRAAEVRVEAEAQRGQTVADAQKEAQAVLDNARATAKQEATELRRQSLKEIRTILTRAEDMRAAAGEELETQRILTNVAKLKTTSRRLLADALGPEDAGPSAEVAAVTDVSRNGDVAPNGASIPEPEPPKVASDPQPQPAKSAKEKKTSTR